MYEYMQTVKGAVYIDIANDKMSQGFVTLFDN